jgi:hypothetical protein
MPDDFHKSDFQAVAWTLVDSDGTKEGPPNSVMAHGTQHFVIFTTFPVNDRWSHMHKTAFTVVVVMNPWTREEILLACVCF